MSCRRISLDTLAVIVGIALVIVFALGLALGAKVEQGIRRPAATETGR